MAHFDTPGDHRDDVAADRDDRAESRDVASSGRDTAADLRDIRADARADQVKDQARDLTDRLAQVRGEILDRLARIEDTVVDEADWPDLSAADLDRLRAQAAERRRLVALERAAIGRLVDDLRTEVQRGRIAGDAAALDRVAAAQDRRAARGDRRHSAQDRDDSARDRAQAAIERVQTDGGADDGPDSSGPLGIQVDEALADRVARAVVQSRQRIADSRAHLTRTDHHTAPTATDDEPGGGR
jgi:hypothetical protein